MEDMVLICAGLVLIVVSSSYIGYTVSSIKHLKFLSQFLDTPHYQRMTSEEKRGVCELIKTVIR